MGRLLYIREEQQKPSGSQLVTLADLEKFRVTLMMDIKLILEGSLGKPAKRWLKSHEVRKLLNISYGTLQTLRNNGKLPYTRIGGLIYYDAVEIDQILTDQKKAS
jgi:Helix-turn-helix domain